MVRAYWCIVQNVIVCTVYGARCGAASISCSCRFRPSGRPIGGVDPYSPLTPFYEWKATKGGKQPYAIAMKDHSPFGIAGIWENWKNPDGEWVRTFAILTTPANELVGTIHDRMPAILAPAAYERWLGTEPDPQDLLQLFHQKSWRFGLSRRGSTRRRMTTSLCWMQSGLPRTSRAYDAALLHHWTFNAAS